MDNQEKAAFKGAGDELYEYPKLFTLSEFTERYGEDNCTIMLQNQELGLYRGKQVELSRQDFAKDEDAHQNMQAALDAWKPCDDRPPTEIEAMVQRLLSMPHQAQAQLYRLIGDGVEKQEAEQAQVDAVRATEQSQAIDEEFRPPENVGPPVTKPQQEPAAPASFEELGAQADQATGNAKAVAAAQEGHEADVAANSEDYSAPTAFEQGGDEEATEEGPAQTEVGMPPPQTA